MNSEELILVIFGLALRAMTATHPHSGQAQPPMFGDYEAQRHWQEITVNLPMEKWYYNSSDNDLLYWGLDYPPLTAYHSWILGKMAFVLNPGYVELKSSRGFESYEHKIFMRNSVLFADLCIFLPGILAFVKSLKSGQDQKIVQLAAFLLYPGQILIDSGHFQYNNVSLGLFVMAVAFLMRDRILVGSVAFVLALSYKQMELYHSLPFFFYLLGLCARKEHSWTSAFVKLVKIGLVVIVTFGLVWWPFLHHLKQVLTRIFPLNRGLFEDKVANIWCALNIVFKLKTQYSSDFLALISAITTLTLSLPSNLALFWRPTKEQFLYALFNTSLVFFLCSYQVHEKSILLVAFPALMTYPLNQGRYSNLMLTWFLLTTVFSMWPLIFKDGLLVAFACLTIIFGTFAHFVGFFDLQESSDQNSKKRSPKPLTSSELMKATCKDWIIWTFFNLSLIGFVVMILANLFVKPPEKWPHLWPLMISVYSAAHFVAFWPYFMWCQYKVFQIDLTKKTK